MRWPSSMPAEMIHFHRFAGFHAAFATAFDAGLFDFLAAAVAGWAGLLHLENRLAHMDGAASRGRWSRCWPRCRAWRRSRGKHRILHTVGTLDALFDAFGGFFQG